MRRYGWWWAGSGAAFLLGTGMFACGAETEDQASPVPTAELPGYLAMTTEAGQVPSCV